MELQQPELRQRGRASIAFLAQLGRAAGPVGKQVADDLAAAIEDPAALPRDPDALDATIQAALEGSMARRVQALMGDWHGRWHGRIAIEAFEEIEEALAPALEAATQGPATLALDPDLVPPAYFAGVHFHRTSGGWDGHRHMGYVHGEIVHRKMVDRLYPGGIFRQRRAVAEMAPRDHYDRILDMGCSSGHFTTALAETYPDAEISGIDLSARMLEHAQRIANSRGWGWRLYQRAAENSGFADESFDLVTSYIMLHEMPADAIRAVFAEAWRVLKPGGDLLMSDVTRYADLDPVGQWKADESALRGGEPHWRSSASLDLAEVARAAGFQDVMASGIYPHVVTARKA